MKLRAGPKPDPHGEPLDLSGLPTERGQRACAFIERYCRIPKGVGALEPVRLRPWQREITEGLFRAGVTQGLVSCGRGNSKTTTAGMWATYAAYGDGVEGARVYVVAATMEQAALTFATVRRMVELSPELAGLSQIHQQKIVIPSTDSVIAPLPATANNLLGRDPSFVVVDELAVVPDDVYSSMALGLGKRENSLLVAISTAPVSPDSAMWRLRELGLSDSDPAFYFKEFAAPAGCAVDDESVWAAANPALDDFLSRQALRSNLRTCREAEFRRYRLNQVVEDVGAWLEFGMWERLAQPQEVPAGARIVAGFDGSTSGDSTAIVCATLDPEPYVFVWGLWSAPEGPQGKDWRVPRGEVSEAVRALYDRFSVAELACDPAWWRSEIEQWSLLYPGVVEFPFHSVSRAAPATGRAYSAIKQGLLTHDGNPELARHFRNATVRESSQGAVIQKFHKDSPRHVDLAVATVIALDRAAFHLSQPTKRRRVVAF